VLGLWLIAVVVGVMSLAASGMASSPFTPGGVSLIAGLFALVGLVLLRAAVRATGRAWVYRGAFASFHPAEPRAGAHAGRTKKRPEAACRQRSRPLRP